MNSLRSDSGTDNGCYNSQLKRTQTQSFPHHRAGLPSGNRHTAENFAPRFWSKVDRRSPGECWPWKGSRLVNGRGQVCMPSYGVLRKPRRYAPVVAWELTHGPLAPRTRVLHRCDNPNCVNPNHLFTGTQYDNVHDCIQKSRRNAYGRQKLTEADVLAIRRRGAAGERQADIAKDYGLARHSVSGILHRKSWQHLPVETHIRSESIPAIVLEGVPYVQIHVRGEVA